MSAVKEFDKYREAGAYHWKYLDNPAHHYTLRVSAVCEKVRPHDNCLDLGCGDGAYISRVAPRCRHVVGVDADPDGIRCAGDELARHGVTNVTLIQSSFAELDGRLPTAIRRYELVYSMDVIEHLDDPHGLLDLMERQVTPGGTIIVGTPLFVSAEEVSPYHVKEYTVSELHEMLLPRFVRLEERFLPAKLPQAKKVVPRFYLFYGRPRRRWWRFWR